MATGDVQTLSEPSLFEDNTDAHIHPLALLSCRASLTREQSKKYSKHARTRGDTESVKVRIKESEKRRTEGLKEMIEMENWVCDSGFE